MCGYNQQLNNSPCMANRDGLPKTCGTQGCLQVERRTAGAKSKLNFNQEEPWMTFTPLA